MAGLAVAALGMRATKNDFAGILGAVVTVALMQQLI
jgi:hypothetical protein